MLRSRVSITAMTRLEGNGLNVGETTGPQNRMKRVGASEPRIIAVRTSITRKIVSAV